MDDSDAITMDINELDGQFWIVTKGVGKLLEKGPFPDLSSAENQAKEDWPLVLKVFEDCGGKLRYD